MVSGPAIAGRLPRHAMSLLDEALSDFRVVVLNGPRQSGKTTLVQLIHEVRGGSLLSLDDPAVLAAARADPTGFVHGYAEPILIDEVQRGGDALVLAIKLAVDQDPRAGRFLLAGSTRFLTVPVLSESLAGRAAIVDLWALSQGEIAGVREGFIDRLFSAPAVLRGGAAADLVRADYFRLVCAGGFPEALAKRTERARATWFASYVRTVTQRDVTQISQARQLDELPRLLRLLAAMTAQELNAARLAASAGMTDDTVRRYLPLLATVYLIVRVPAWSRNLTSKVKRHPKVYLADTGLAARLLGVTAAGLSQPVAPAAGPLLETFVLNELVKQQTWNELGVTLCHYRDRDGAEVDLILEADDGRVAGIEVKAGATVTQQDVRHLRLLRDKLGSSFAHGVVLYTGARRLSFGDRLTALPVATLWEQPPV